MSSTISFYITLSLMFSSSNVLNCILGSCICSFTCCYFNTLSYKINVMYHPHDALGLPAIFVVLHTTSESGELLDIENLNLVKFMNCFFFITLSMFTNSE